MYKLMFPLLAVLVILSLGFFTLDSGSDFAGSAFSEVPGYIDTEEFFYGYPTLFASYGDDGLSVVISDAVGDIFVYKDAFYDLDGEWTEIELEATNADISQNGPWNDSWIRGSAEGSVEVPYDEYHVAAYVCRLYNRTEVLELQDWSLNERLAINHTFTDELVYLCGVGGFDTDDGLVDGLWHLDQIECEDCVTTTTIEDFTLPATILIDEEFTYSFNVTLRTDAEATCVVTVDDVEIANYALNESGKVTNTTTLNSYGEFEVEVSCSDGVSTDVARSTITANECGEEATCQEGFVCDEGVCTEDICIPTITCADVDNQCGVDDGCGNTLNCCDSGFLCDADICVGPEGSGTPEDPYLVSSCDELQAIDNNLDAHYELVNNIDCSGFSFTSIAHNSGRGFNGSLEGNQYSISGITINEPSSLGYHGLFSKLHGTVSNLELSDISITGRYWLGLLAGQSYTASVSDVRVSGDITTYDSTVGGLIGSAFNTSITRSHADVDITLANTHDHGGDAGGFVGRLGSSGIEYSSARGTITGSGEGSNVGGFAGLLYSRSYISESYAETDINIPSVSTVGGFFGQSVATSLFMILENTYSRSSVSAENHYGGFASRIWSGGDISKSYVAGMVSESGESTGGFMVTTGYRVSNSYWDTEATGQSTSSGGYAKTTSQMKTQSTYSGWDFDNVWAIDSSGSINDGYPYLQNNPPSGGSTPECSSDGDCGTGLVCESGSCVSAYSWKSGSWSSCSSECDGSQTRSVWCERNDGVEVSDSNCDSASKPSSSQSCGSCPSGKSCSSGICVECSSSTECPSNMMCSNNQCVCETDPVCDGQSLNEPFCSSGLDSDVIECTQDANGCVSHTVIENCQYLEERCGSEGGVLTCVSESSPPELMFSTQIDGYEVSTVDVSTTVYGRVEYDDINNLEACAAVGDGICEDGDFVDMPNNDWYIDSNGIMRTSFSSDPDYGGYVGDVTYIFRDRSDSSLEVSKTLTFTNS